MKTFNYGSEIAAKNSLYYPIHLTSEELSLILDCVISNIYQSNHIIAFARKSKLKGVEYKIVCASNSNVSNAENIKREYSILIHPNWSIQILDHWSDGLGSIRCEIIDKGSEDLNKIIFDDILNKINIRNEVEENSIFLKDEWVCIRKIKDVVLI
jgi:hypothetical protein